VAKVFHLFQRTDFDPETIAVLTAAFEKARKSLHDKGQPPLVEEIIAGRIIAAAKTGELDPDRLCEAALMKALGNKAVFE
jgi:hypothetical protein